MKKPVNDYALDLIWRHGRTYNGWTDQPVSETTIRAIYDLTKMGMTSANCSPARFTFISSHAGKQRLKPFLMASNVDKTMSAPWTVIISHDLEFREKLPDLFPHDQTARDWFADDDVREATAFRNGTLSGAYLMLAARALGLDCGPMSGFDNAGIDREFFLKDEATRNWRSNWICNIGHGDPDSLFERSPRLSFSQACQVL
ncbi:MAG: malonic semialdehyde reductase [Alphaproteobacteria bacterium]|nr:malonic semialdehyde reductase [Alphaproteobacteria bacterium]